RCGAHGRCALCPHGPGTGCRRAPGSCIPCRSDGRTRSTTDPSRGRGGDNRSALAASVTRGPCSSTSPSHRENGHPHRSGSSSTSSQALASGYERVLCCAEIDEARELASTEAPAVLAGERRLEAIDGFDF